MNRSRVTGDLASHGNIFVDIANDRVGIGSTIPAHKLSLPDSARIALGDSADFQLYHTGSEGNLFNSTGHIHIRASSEQVFIDGTTVHLRNHAGSETFLKGTANGAVELRYDNVKKFETQSAGAKVTGQLNVAASVNNEGIKVTNSANNASVILRSTGSTDTGGFRFNHNSPNSQITIDRTNGSGAFSANLIFISSTGDLKLVNDNSKLQVGASQDLSIYHDGSHSYIDDTGTGNLKVRSNNFRVSNADESKISGTFVPSGAVELYHNNSKKFETTSSGATVSGQLTAGTSGGQNPSQTSWATNSALNLYGSYGGGIAFNDNGNNGFVQYVESQGTIFNLKTGAVGGSLEQVIRAVKDGQVELYYNNTKTFETTPLGIKVPDSKRLSAGDGEDLKIYHNGSTNNFIAVTGGQVLTTNSDSLVFKNADNNETYATFTDDGSVDLYYDNTKRIETTSSGATITGDAIIDAVKVGAWSGGSTYKGIFHSSHSSSEYIIMNNDNHTFISASSGGSVYIRTGANDSTNQLIVSNGDNGLTWRGNKVFHGGNDGSGSGLDADTLDGVNSGSFLRSDTNDTVGGILTFVSGSGLNLSTNDIYLNARVINNQAGGSDDGLYIGYNNANNGLTRLYGGGATTGGLDVRGSGVNDVKINGNTVWHAGNDGAGSGLDADLLDGISSVSFVRSDADDILNGQYTISDGADEKLILSGSSNPYIRWQEGTTNKAYIQWNANGYFDFVNSESGERLRLQSGSNGLKYGIDGTFYKIWHEANDGTGSGLDADTVDGIQGANFVRSDTSDTMSGTLSVDRIDVTGSHGIDNESWYRNDDSGEGIYNTATGQHFYSDDDDYWNIAGGGSANGLRFRDDHAGTIRGYVYANNSNQIGFLNQSGSWTLRTQTAGITKLGSLGNGYQIRDGNVANNLYIYTAGTGSASSGISVFNADGAWRFQLYGTSTQYGFLDANWGGWDIRKTVNGSFHVDEGSGLQRVWNAGNDGSGSGLDADTVDGKHASGFFQQSGSWLGDLGSNGFTRENGLNMTGGAEFVLLSKSGQGHVLIDGDYHAYEAGGYFSYYNSNFSSQVGFYSDSTTSAIWKGHLKPSSNNSQDLGTSSVRWRNIYTNDLNLSNEGSVNDIDGTWGNFTIQEGEDDLFLINKRNGKKYKFNLTEV